MEFVIAIVLLFSIGMVFKLVKKVLLVVDVTADLVVTEIASSLPSAQREKLQAKLDELDK